MRLFLSVPLLLLAACTVPDKFFSDAGGGGDDQIDAGGTSPDAETDTTAPETTVTMMPGEFSNDGTPSFEFEANEAANFLCSFDAETPVACTSPTTRSLGDGPHTFAVRAVDLAGNQDETPAEHPWTIDTVVPETTIDTGPPTNDNSTSVMFTFSADEANVTFECQLDSGAFAACLSPAVVSSLGNGPHIYRVRATDRAGNVDATPDTHGWTVDTSTPDTTIDSGPNGATNSTSASFAFSSANAGGGATYECRVLPAAFAACTSPRMYTGLTEATTYTFEVRVRNAALTYDPTPATRTWTPDLTPPNTSFVSGNPSGAVSSTSVNIAFTSNEAGSTFQCSLEGAAFTACTSPSVQSGLSQGAHTFAVRAIDAAGLMDATPALASWTVDTVAPTTSTTGPVASSTSTSATFDFSSNETGVTYRCRVDAVAYAVCTDPFTTTVGQNGHTLDVYATDTAGNADLTPAQHAWTVDSVGPIVTFVSPTPAASSTVGPYNTYAWTVNRTATTACSINGGAAFPCTSPYTTHTKAGVTTFAVAATDTFGNAATFTRSFTIACSAAVADGSSGNVFGLLHMDEGTSQTLTNVGNGVGNGVVGTTIDNETVDPIWTTAGRFGNALTFVAAENDTVAWNMGTAAALATHDHTIEIWVRPSTFTTSTQDVFATSGGTVRLTLEPVSSSYYAQYSIIGGGVTTTVTAGTPLTAGVWHHLVATYSGTTMTLYQDAEAKAVTTPTISGTFTFSGIRINTFTKPMPGQIDEVWLSRAPLTAAQVMPRYCPT